MAEKPAYRCPSAAGFKGRMASSLEGRGRARSQSAAWPRHASEAPATRSRSTSEAPPGAVCGPWPPGNPSAIRPLLTVRAVDASYDDSEARCWGTTEALLSPGRTLRAVGRRYAVSTQSAPGLGRTVRAVSIRVRPSFGLPSVILRSRFGAHQAPSLAVSRCLSSFRRDRAGFPPVPRRILPPVRRADFAGGGRTNGLPRVRIQGVRAPAETTPATFFSTGVRNASARCAELAASRMAPLRIRDGRGGEAAGQAARRASVPAPDCSVLLSLDRLGCVRT